MPARPATGTSAVPVAAGVVGDAGVGAVLATRDMTAQRGGTADLDRGHDAPLGEAQMRRVDSAPSGAVAAEDIRHFELRTRHCRRVSPALSLQVQVVERALDLPDQVDGNAGIAHGRLDVPMSKQVLDDANVDTLFEQMGRKTVSQRVDGDRFAQARGFGGAPAGQLQRALGHRPRWIATGKQPVRRARRRQ